MAKRKSKSANSPRSTKKKQVQNPYAVKQISVKNLFGHYSYTLPQIKKNQRQELDKLFILYGDNGSGKTTILKAVFYLLSTKDKAGFKTRLSEIKFSKFSVLLENEIEIGADRGNKIEGEYVFYIKKNGQFINQIKLMLDHSLAVRVAAGSPEDVKLQAMYQYINNLQISVHYLADNRKLTNSYGGILGDEPNKEESVSENYEYSAIHRILQRTSKKETVREGDELYLVEKRFVAWVRQKMIDSSHSSETTAVNIYTDLVKNIDNVEISSVVISKSELLQTIKDLSTRSIEYSKFGLVNSYEYSEIIDVFSKVKDQYKSELIYRIVKPYFDSLEARLIALESLQNLLLNLVNTINQYYSRKRLEFNANSGFTLIHEKGGILTFEDLSSGEKQILLLLISAITASDQATLFIIDEPEISLNVKWQRNLLKSLTEFSKNGKVQFMIATHSIELLASNLENVVKIEE